MGTIIEVTNETVRWEYVSAFPHASIDIVRSVGGPETALTPYARSL